MVAQIDTAMFKMRPWKVPGRLISWALIEGRPLTTRGRWINSLVFALYRLARIVPEAEGARRPIYIIGTGRSGTTVLGTLFAIHKDTVFLNEPKALWHHAVGGEDLIGSYDPSPGQVRLDPARARPESASRIARVYSVSMRAGAARRVADKYPELVFRIPFVKALFPHARFVAILRDGVDTCSSVVGWSKRKGGTVEGETHDWWGRDGRKWRLIVEQLVPEHPDLAPLQARLATTTDHRDRAALEWIVSMRAARVAAADHPEVLAIRYEDLCADPETTLARLCRHCGLAEDPVFLAYAQSVLAAPEAYKPLEIMPELVAPFRAELAAMGYGESQSRVLERETR